MRERVRGERAAMYLARSAFGGLGLVACLVVSCGGKLASDAAPEGSRAIDCASITFDPAAPNYECSVKQGTCELIGTLPDGRAIQEICTSDGAQNNRCALLVDGAEVCTCPSSRIDFSNVCGNTVPTCSGWSASYVSIILKCPTK